MIIRPVKHRIPPKPLWMKGVPKGTCQWCLEPIYPGQRTRPRSCNWHRECLCEYRSIFDWPYIRGVVFKRDKGHCKACGQGLYDWAYWEKNTHYMVMDYEVDHIIPLFRWPEQNIKLLTWDNLPQWYAPWSIQNLQLLCVDCHRTKTAEERRKPIVKNRFNFRKKHVSLSKHKSL